MNINSKNTPSTFSDQRKAYNISNEIIKAIKNNNIHASINDYLILNIINDEWAQNQQELTIMDAYYVPPKYLNRSNLILYEILFKLLGKQSEKSENLILNKHDLQELKDILDWAAKHTIRIMKEAAIKDSNPEFLHWKKRQKKLKYSIWIWYFKNTFKDLVEIDWDCNVKFKLNTPEDFLTIVRKLLSPHQKKLDNNWNEINKFTLAKELKNWLFMKNILAYSDLKKNKIHADITTLFKKTINDIFCPILNLNKDNINSKSEYSKTFNLSIPIKTPKKDDSTNQKQAPKRKRISGKFIFCTKSEESIIDKILRDWKYQTTEDLNDMLRWSIIVKKYEDLIFLLHYFIKLFIKNNNGNFYHSKNSWIDFKDNKLRDLVLKDKWILITNNEERKRCLNNLPEWEEPEDWTNLEKYTDENLDWIATKFLKGISNKKSTDTNSTNSENYIDTKLLIPIKAWESSTSIELKFLLKEQADTNDKWLSSHKIMRLRQNIQKIIRNQKYISANKIRTMIKSLLDSEPELKREIQQQLNEAKKKSIKILWKDFAFEGNPEDHLFDKITKNDLIIIEDIKIEWDNLFFSKDLSESYQKWWLLPNRKIVSEKLPKTEKEKKEKKDRKDRKDRKEKTQINVNEVKKIRKEKSIALINEIKNYEWTNKFRNEEKKKKILNLKNKLNFALNHNNLENIKKYYIALQRECIDWIIKDESD